MSLFSIGICYVIYLFDCYYVANYEDLILKNNPPFSILSLFLVKQFYRFEATK